MIPTSPLGWLVLAPAVIIGTIALGRCDGTFTTVRRERRQVLETNDDRYCLAHNRTNGEGTVLSGPAREGLALLQGLLLCGTCGRSLTMRYADACVRGADGVRPLPSGRRT